MTDNVIYLMRGLPSCGKSHTARKLAGQTGVVCETDAFFYTQVGADPSQYDYDPALLQAARDWNFDCFQRAVDAGRSPIVVDRGNSRNRETQRYARYGIDHGYQVELKEPQSPWWREIRMLLRAKQIHGQNLDRWAQRLAQINQSTHRTSAATIRHWMTYWQPDLTIEDILKL